MSATNKSESASDLDCGATPDFASILVCETLIRIFMKLERMEEWQMLSHILTFLKGCSWTVDAGGQFLSDPSLILALPCRSVSPSLFVLNSVQIAGFVQVVTLISYIVIWICQTG